MMAKFRWHYISVWSIVSFVLQDFLSELLRFFSSSFHDPPARVQKIFTEGPLLHLSSTLIRNDKTTVAFNRNGNLNWAIF